MYAVVFQELQQYLIRLSMQELSFAGRSFFKRYFVSCSIRAFMPVVCL